MLTVARQEARGRVHERRPSESTSVKDDDVEAVGRMAGERDLDRQRIEAVGAVDALARDAQGRVVAYQQHLRSRLLVAPDRGSVGTHRWRALLVACRGAWMTVVRALP